MWRTLGRIWNQILYILRNSCKFWFIYHNSPLSPAFSLNSISRFPTKTFLKKRSFWSNTIKNIVSPKNSIQKNKLLFEQISRKRNHQLYLLTLWLNVHGRVIWWHLFSLCSLFCAVFSMWISLSIHSFMGPNDAVVGLPKTNTLLLCIIFEFLFSSRTDFK